jgi:hypothetical protein
LLSPEGFVFNQGLDVSGEFDPVVAWRIERLRDAGFSARLAGALAHDARYDVHALLELTDRGCSAELGARILAPLGGDLDPRR